MPLRPFDFLPGTNVPVNSKPDTLRQDINDKKQYLENIWERWLSEYLIELRTWNKTKKCENFVPNEGDVVMINPKNVKLSQCALWPLGLVMKLFPGKDGFPRNALVWSDGKNFTTQHQPIIPS